MDALDGGSGGGAGSFYEGQTPISNPGSETVGQGNAGGGRPRCTLVFTGFLPRALVAQRIEQKTSNLLVAGSIPAEGA